MKTFKEFKNELKLQNTSLDRHRKISDRDKKEIKNLYEEGIKINEISKIYNVTPYTIRYHLNPLSKLENAKKKYKEYHNNSPEKNREIARRKRESSNKYKQELYEIYVKNTNKMVE